MQEQIQAVDDESQQTPESQAAQQRLRSQLSHLRDKAWKLIHSNEQASERERLSRQDLVIAVKGMGQLKSLGQARVEALRKSIQQSGVKEDIIWGRLKAVGWDGMELQQASLTGIKSSAKVRAYTVVSLCFHLT